MIDAVKEFEEHLGAIENPREKLLFGKGFVEGFKVGCESSRENVAKTFELLAKGELLEYLEKLKKEAE